MTNITLLTGLLFRQIIFVVWFSPKDFSATGFTVGEEAMFHQIHTTEIKEAINIISFHFFLYTQIVMSGSCCGPGGQGRLEAVVNGTIEQLSSVMNHLTSYL